ncbi:cytochrome c oxidase subunit 8, mitochondrial [Diutina catenulata]
MFKTGLNVASRRGFSSSAVRANNIYGTPKSGPYSNLPFKVKDRMIPFPVVFWGVAGFFFAFPFLSSYWQMKKAGNI